MEGGPTFYNVFKHPLISHLSCCGSALIAGFVEGCLHFSFLLGVFFLEWIIYGLKRQHKQNSSANENWDKIVSLFFKNHGILSRRNLRQISSVHGARCSQGGRCSASHLHWRTWSPGRSTWNRDCVRLLPPWHSKPDRKTHFTSYHHEATCKN